MKPETDTIYQIYDEQGNFIQVRPYPDSPDSPCLMTVPSPYSDGFYGKLNVTFTVDFAVELAQALLSCAKDIRKRNKI